MTESSPVLTLNCGKSTSMDQGLEEYLGDYLNYTKW